MATPPNKLFAVLRKRVGFEVVSHNETPGQLRILGRIPVDALNLNNNNWKIVMWRLLKAQKARPWKIDISKHYFIKEETDKLVFAWRVLIQGEGVEQHYVDIMNIIESSPAARAEVMEIPLVGRGNNDTGGGRRGAAPMNQAVVGPMAALQKTRGG